MLHHSQQILHLISKWRKIWSLMWFSCWIWATLKRWSSKSKKHLSSRGGPSRGKPGWLWRRKSSWEPRNCVSGTITRWSTLVILIWFFHLKSLKRKTIRSFLKRRMIAMRSLIIEARLPKNAKRQLRQMRSLIKWEPIRMWLLMALLGLPPVSRLESSAQPPSV